MCTKVQNSGGYNGGSGGSTSKSQIYALADESSASLLKVQIPFAWFCNYFFRHPFSMIHLSDDCHAKC